VTRTRQQLVESAFAEIGMASHTYDLAPDMLLAAHEKLDDMATEWLGSGINIGFNLGADPSDEAGVASRWHSAVYTNLAIRLASSYGKEPSIDLRLIASNSFQRLLIEAVAPVAGRQLPGNVPISQHPQTSSVRNAKNGGLEFLDI
jgi:broad specificity polyphosphatase/5'/3'-nucleotidase SurE